MENCSFRITQQAILVQHNFPVSKQETSSFIWLVIVKTGDFKIFAGSDPTFVEHHKKACHILAHGHKLCVISFKRMQLAILTKLLLFYLYQISILR